jgi:hypothetical protein
MGNAQNIKLEDRDPLVLKEKLERVVFLVASIKEDKSRAADLTAALTLTEENLGKNQGELKLLEGELFVKARKPRALKPALKNPPAPRKEKKDKAEPKPRSKSYVVPGKTINISAKLLPGETAPGDPRQAALPIDKK